MAMHIEASPNNIHTHGKCLLCGEGFEWGDVVGIAWFDEDKPDEGEIIICDECARGSVENIRTRILTRVGQHRRIADDLEAAAAGEIIMAPLSAFTAIEEQIAAEYTEFVRDNHEALELGVEVRAWKKWSSLRDSNIIPFDSRDAEIVNWNEYLNRELYNEGFDPHLTSTVFPNRFE